MTAGSPLSNTRVGWYGVLGGLVAVGVCLAVAGATGWRPGAGVVAGIAGASVASTVTMLVARRRDARCQQPSADET